MSDKRTETCCCTGHRDIPYGLETPLKSVLKEQVGLLLSKGVIYYGVGGAVGFDTLAAEALFELRTEYPQIKVILVYPFSGFDSRWQKEQRDRDFSSRPHKMKISRTPMSITQALFHSSRYLKHNPPFKYRTVGEQILHIRHISPLVERLIAGEQEIDRHLKRRRKPHQGAQAGFFVAPFDVGDKCGRKVGQLCQALLRDATALAQVIDPAAY